MNTYIALLRGINIGGTHVLAMKDLAGILEGMGCKDVKTYIQSGNAVFRAVPGQKDTLGGEIGSRILESHGFTPKVMVLEVSDLKEAIRNNPFDTDNGKALHFFFLESCPRMPDLEKLDAVKSATEAFELHDKVFYLYAPDGVGRSRLAPMVERGLGVPATGRNWNTVRKLISLAAE